MSASTLTPEQRRAVEAPGSVAVTAGAGTGKTHMLTERYVHHVQEDGLGPLEIVAATFTDRAAAELRSRIREQLRLRRASPELTAELEAAQIGTLHALAGRICREHPEAAGVPYDFVVQEAVEQRLWRERRFAEAIDRLPAGVARGVPFRILTEVLQALLDDPYTAERALGVDPASLHDLIAAERERVFRDLAASDAWLEAVDLFRTSSGPPDDKMELQRAAALAALDAFASGRFDAASCEALDTLNAARGSRKAWDEPTLGALKKACQTLRGLYREGAHVFGARLGEADELLEKAIGGVREAYRRVRGDLERWKREGRVLDFNDLELCALRALQNPAVLAFYRKRWRAFLVDEFQDTNPVQADLLARLTEGATLTVVGDEKQSIYGFRRADVRVFRGVRAEIEAQGGAVQELARSFRTHRELVEQTNAVVRPALADLHQELAAARAEAPGEGPFLRVHLMEADRGVRKPFRRRAEAHRIADIVQHDLLGANALVHDRGDSPARPVRPGDIAILSRTWAELEPFGAELAARGIPTIHAGGGDLFGQREAKDALALLRFLADPSDDVSLVAVLRSPFFAVSDIDLTRFAERVGEAKRRRRRELRAGNGGRTDEAGDDAFGPPEELPAPAPNAEVQDRPAQGWHVKDWHVPWWHVLRETVRRGEPVASEDPPLAFAASVLTRLLEQADDLLPSELLAAADARTGYTAAIANLPGGPRRLADWKGLVGLVARLEEGHGHLFAVVRQLDELAALESSAVPRPALEGGDAVALMTVHNAKGLEWPVVIVPDVTGSGSGSGSKVLFEAEAGVAFKVWDRGGEEVEPVLYQILKHRAKAREEAEEMRVLYVALTRARDRLVLTANDVSGGKLDRIRDGLEHAGVELEVAPYDPEHAVPGTPKPPEAERPASLLLEAPGPGFEHLDVTSLSTYSICPKRFEFEVRRGHPGAPVRPEVAEWLRRRSQHDGSSPTQGSAGAGIGRRIGELTHVALERGIDRFEALAPHDEALEARWVERALELATVFRTDEKFAPFRGPGLQRREVPLAHRRGGVVLHGKADAVGAGFVLDYKTGDPEVDDAFHLQVAVYAAELDRPRAHIAYLRTPDEGGGGLETLERAEIAAALARVDAAVAGIRQGSFGATPGELRCARCAFEAICRASVFRDTSAGR